MKQKDEHLDGWGNNASNKYDYARDHQNLTTEQQ
jgi:hypothetical protein